MSETNAETHTMVLRIGVRIPLRHMKYKVHRKPKKRTNEVLDHIGDRIRDLLEQDPEINSLLEKIDGSLVVGAKSEYEKPREQRYGADIPDWHVHWGGIFG